MWHRKKTAVMIAFFLLCAAGPSPGAQGRTAAGGQEGVGAREFLAEEDGRGRSRVSRKKSRTHMTLDEKLEIRKRYKRFRHMPPEKQEILKRRWRAFKNLSPEQQEKIRQKHQRFMAMDPEERERLLRRRERWLNLSPEERELWRQKKRGGGRGRDGQKKGKKPQGAREDNSEALNQGRLP